MKRYIDANGMKNYIWSLSTYEIHKVTAEMYNCNTDYFPDEICFCLDWEANIGWGEIRIHYNTKNKKWTFDTEGMSNEFCKNPNGNESKSFRKIYGCVSRDSF